MGPRVAPTARGTAQYTARVPRHNSSEATSSTPSPPPPARRPLVPRLTSAAQDKRWSTSSAPRSCRRRSALLPASRRGGRPPCKQHERLVSPSPRPAASSTTSTSIPSASTAHRGVAVTSHRHAREHRPCAWPKFRRPRDSNERRPARSPIDGFTRHYSCPPSAPHGQAAAVLVVLCCSTQQSLLRARLRGGLQTNALNALRALNVLLSTVRRMSQASLPWLWESTAASRALELNRAALITRRPRSGISG